MSAVDDVLADLEQQNASTIASLKADLAKLRTGRASIAILDAVRVSYYGTPTPLSQCANLSVLDARTIAVKPWDKGIISDIEKAILMAGIGITPQNDGDLIRLPIPQLTEERRKSLVKQARQRAEEAKIALRNHRRDANEMLKEVEKEKEISEDQLKRALQRVQEIIDGAAIKVDDVLKSKEKEILEI